MMNAWQTLFTTGRITRAALREQQECIRELHTRLAPYLAPPLPASSAERGPSGVFGRQLAQVAARQPRYPALRLHAAFQIYPDDWFADEIHLKEERLPDVAKDYADILGAMGFGPAMP